MYSAQPQKEAIRSTYKHPWHGPQIPQGRGKRVDSNKKMLNPYISHKSHIGKIARKGPLEKPGQSKDTPPGYETRYWSSTPSSPPKWSSPNSPAKGSINIKYYPQRSPNASKAEEHWGKNYPIKKNHKNRHLTPKQKRIIQKSSQRGSGHNAKQHKQINNKTLEKITLQKVELELKDQQVARLVSEMARLQRGIYVYTIKLRSNKLKIIHQRKYIRDISERSLMLQRKNMAMKRVVSGLSELRKENQQQKELILKLAYHCENYKELVLLLKDAETMNESLRRMVRNEASSNPHYTGNYEGFIPLSHPETTSVQSPYRYAKSLNPKASCFKAITNEKYPNIKFTDDEWATIKEQICSPNKTRKTEKLKPNHTMKTEKIKTNFFAAEMKRMFAEACIEGPAISSKVLVKVQIDVVKENHNDAVKVALPVLVLKSPPSSEQQSPVADKVLKSTLSSCQQDAESVTNIPVDNIVHHDKLTSFSPAADKQQLNVSKKVEDMSSSEKVEGMNFQAKNDRKPGFAPANWGDCGTEDTEFLAALLSIQDNEKIDQTFGFENLY